MSAAAQTEPTTVTNGIQSPQSSSSILQGTTKNSAAANTAQIDARSQTPAKTGAKTGPAGNFHHCKWLTATFNDEGYMTQSETYACDEGEITLHGSWGYTIQDGIKYHHEMGRQSEKTEPATVFDMDFWKWCPNANGTLEMCGFNEHPKMSSPVGSSVGKFKSKEQP